MLVEDPELARFEIIVISDDDDHARLLLADVDTSRHPFLVNLVSERRRIAPALEWVVERSPRRMPVIVLLDFEFLRDACEKTAAQVVAMQNQTAIECIVTRPPPFGGVIERLSRMGASVFDPDADHAQFEQMLH